LSGNAVRLQAINNVEAYVPPAISFDPAEAPGEIFGSSVFTKAEMQLRLPKSVYKSVLGTIDKGAKLDPASAADVRLVVDLDPWPRCRESPDGRAWSDLARPVRAGTDYRRRRRD